MHNWQPFTGTTYRCETCHCVRFTNWDRRGRPLPKTTVYSPWFSDRQRWGTVVKNYVKAEPECLPSRKGH